MRYALLLALFLGGLNAQALAVQTIILVETEGFDECGGWVNDSQFIDQMGSPYLMAIGLGKPVQDAVTAVAMPRPGRYRLWARTKDWVPEHHPGQFRIAIDGHEVDRIFGASGRPGWHWEDGGTQQVSSGKVELRLRDLTGYYGRCDAIVLSSDLDWQPPDDPQKLATLRESQHGMKREIEDAGRFDVVVVGGGLAGCMAAVSSARLGAKTVLIQNRPVLAGNASVEILVPPVGFWPYGKQYPLDPHETGLVEEIKGLGIQRLDEAVPYSGRLMRLAAAEPNLTLRLNAHVTGVEKASPSSIAAVIARDVQSGRRTRFRGRVFIDCTGDGTVGVAAGAEYRQGREARSMYGESMAPEAADRQTMGNSLKYAVGPTDSPQPFVRPSWAMEFPRCDSFSPGRHPRLVRDNDWQWMIELGGTRDTYRDAEEIRDELLRLIFGMWDHTKNHCDQHREQAANCKLLWVQHVAGKRETRRLIGDYVLNQNDIADQALFPDRVAYGGWGIDDHYPEGFFHQGPPAQHAYKGVPHSIPYRSLYSKNVDNLLMAGRNISASHVAMAATRVMLTCAVIGQAAGTAAAICVEHQTTPRSVYQQHLEQLQQQLLKDGAYLIDLPNRDPRDLARTATVRTSSQNCEATAANVIDGYARAVGSSKHAWTPEPGERLPQWIELSWEKPRAFNVVHVTFLTAAHSPARFALQAQADGKWKTLTELTVGRHRRFVLGFDRVTTIRLRLVLLEKKSAEPGVCEIRVYDEQPEVVETAHRVARLRDLPDSGPGLPWKDTPWGAGLDPRKLPGIVIDDMQAERTGQWIESTYSQPYVLSGYLHDGNTDKGRKSICFSARIAKSRKYEVRLAYLAVNNRATNTPVTIHTAEGRRTLNVNQRLKPTDGPFLSLGVFALEAGEGPRVEIGTAGTDGYVVADAIQLIPAE